VVRLGRPGPTAIGHSFYLPPQFVLGSIEGTAVIGTLTLGYQDLAAGHVEPQLDCLLNTVGIEHDRHLHGVGGQVTEPLHDSDGAFPEGLGHFAVTGGDGRLHERSSELSL